MELLQGETLLALIKREKTLSDSKVASLVHQVSDALATAHEAGVVHRDIKPENLFLQGNDIDRLKIVDFGIAKANDDTSVTQTGAIVGTPGYIAPERLRGDEFDGRADVYSIGAVAYLALTGRHAYSEGKSGPIEVVLSVLNDPLVPIRELVPTASPVLVDWIERMLTKVQGARPLAREVAAAKLL